jgi:hypothetical protein
VVRGWLSGQHFQFDLGSVALLRPELSLPAYAGLVPADRLAPIFNLFDRTPIKAGWYTTRVSRGRARDFRGGRLSYDDHSGIDFVCPVGARVVAAAPGIATLVRDRWLRGGLTLTLDHGDGLQTQYSHLSRVLVEPGQVVQRGETVALAGASGYDLVQFFPFVPPHVHFMVWRDGHPLDPFAAAGERSLWLGGALPVPSGPLAEDRPPARSPADELAVARLVGACADAGLCDELESHGGDTIALAALLDDALFHQAWLWPRAFRGSRVRPPSERPPAIQLTLPLSADDYVGARFADTGRTAPPQQTSAVEEHAPRGREPWALAT